MNVEEYVEDLRCFVPSKDFEVSKEFYLALGFREVYRDEKLALMQLGRSSFFLQNYFVEDWASNTMLDLRVVNADAFWEHLLSLDLPARFPNTVRLAPPRDDTSTGTRRGHFVDPSGVLWHFSQALGSR